LLHDALRPERPVGSGAQRQGGGTSVEGQTGLLCPSGPLSRLVSGPGIGMENTSTIGNASRCGRGTGAHRNRDDGPEYRLGPVQRAIVPVSTGEDRRLLGSLGALVLVGLRVVVLVRLVGLGVDGG